MTSVDETRFTLHRFSLHDALAGTRRDDRGQALVLGVVMLFVLSLFFYFLASFYRHVEQKERTQTTADAVALSLATAEAQALNYVAFTNRAQVAHYVAALNFSAYVSYLSFVESVAVAVKNTPVAPAPLRAAASSYLEANIVGKIDEPVATVMHLVDGANRGLWVSQQVALGLVAATLASGGQEFLASNINVNDPAWRTNGLESTLAKACAAYNVWAFSNIFSPAGGRPLWPVPTLPSGFDPATLDAEGDMIDTVDRTRGGAFLLSRGLVPLGGSFSALSSVLDFVGTASGKRGESKLLRTSEVEAFLSGGERGEKGTGKAVLASVDTLVWAGKALQGALWIEGGSSGRGHHLRGGSGLTPTSDEIPPALHFFGGISPYTSAEEARSLGHGNQLQPDVFVWLSKTADFASLPFSARFVWGGVPLSTRVGEHGLDPLPPGINVVARAQAYYHRPGNWQEPPNFFNPFWRARLAPVAAGLLRAKASAPAVSQVQSLVTGPLGRLVEDGVLTH